MTIELVGGGRGARVSERNSKREIAWKETVRGRDGV